MNESFDELQELAGEYVLGTLAAAKRKEVEQRLPHEPVLRSAVDAWEQRLLPLTSLADPEEPSPQLWPRILKDLRRPSATTQASWARWWNDLRFWRGLAASGVAAAVILGTMLTIRPPIPAPTFMVVLVEPKAQTPGWIVQASLDRQITLTPLRTVDVPNQKALQFWTKGEGWTKPVSLGLVQPGKSLQLTLDKLPPLQANQLFEITLEPDTGSPTGKPTGPILFIGRAVKTT
ncbi:MAG: anti-sigma factor [Pseudomonadota bacterium]